MVSFEELFTEDDQWYFAMLTLFAHIFVVLTITWIARRFKWFQILYCALLIIIIPLSIITDSSILNPVFTYIKAVSVVVPLIIVILVRYYYPDSKYLAWALSILLIINISEAALAETIVLYKEEEEDKHYYRLLNIITGFILVLCLTLPVEGTRVVTINTSKYAYQAFQFDFGANGWFVVVYSIWNFAFVVNYFCTWTRSVLHIGLPVFCVFVLPRLTCFDKLNITVSEWLFARACALLYACYLALLQREGEVAAYFTMTSSSGSCDFAPPDSVLSYILNISSGISGICFFGYWLWISEWNDSAAKRYTDANPRVFALINVILHPCRLVGGNVDTEDKVPVNDGNANNLNIEKDDGSVSGNGNETEEVVV